MAHIEQVTRCFNAISQQILHGLFENIDDFEFTFLPVCMNQEKRGHLFTSSPLNFILTQNKQSLEEGKEPLDVESTIALIVDRMNVYLRDIKEDDCNHITHKISHFTQLYGIIYLFFSDQSIIDMLQESFKDSQSFDDEICCSNTVDPELVPEFDENCNFEMESQQEIIDVGGIIGRVESAFRENNGVPQVEGFIEQFISKIQLIFQSSNNITQNLIESQYIWVEYLTQNKSELNCCNLNSTDDNNEFEDPKCNFETSKRSLAKILKIEDSTIWISGALIMHNSSVVSILPINPIKNLLIKDIFFDPVLRKFNKINRAPVSNPKVVKYSEQVLKDFEEIVNQGKLDFYTSCDDIISTLNIILNMNPNCICTKTKTLAREIKAIAYDNLTIIYEDTDSCIDVLKVIWSTYFIETGSEHTKEWLDSLSNALNIEAILPILN